MISFYCTNIYGVKKQNDADDGSCVRPVAEAGTNTAMRCQGYLSDVNDDVHSPEGEHSLTQPVASVCL